MHIDLQIHVYERLIHVSMFHWLLNIVLETIRESIIFLIHAYKLVYTEYFLECLVNCYLYQLLYVLKLLTFILIQGLCNFWLMECCSCEHFN